MKRHIGLAILILIASCGAGAIARSTWYNKTPGYPHMPWVKDAVPATTDKTPNTSKDPQKDMDPPASGTNGQSHAVASKESPAEVCGCEKRIEGFCVAEIDCVLKHLAAKDAIIVDAREDHDWDESRLIGAVHLPSSAIYENINNIMAVVPTPQHMIIVYCGGGQCEASKNVAIVLREFEYTNVWLYEQGWEEIEASGRFGDYVESGD
ncbi:MAG: rhodanese-like domain-containing protein [Phycisphaerales bacterium]|nr:rhodanese-like domain-containing protein [Phycisphaerales bacterium]MCB9856608.1 rhodanese-like domain-containing protein [Phycisphaerales bacterium]